MAVRHGYGKIAGTDALVFAYDTGDTRNSYRGEPTTNLLPAGVAATHDAASGNAVTVTDATSEKGPGWKKVTITARGTNFRTLQWSYITMNANTLYCHSTVFDWGNMRGKNYFIYFDGNGTGTRAYYRPGDYVNEGSTNIDSTMPDGKFAGTIIHTSSHTHAFFIGNYTLSQTGLNDYFYYKEFQVEVNSHPTQYTTGTRSATQGLLDLTGNNIIDLTNVSFDSNAQMTFDETNDYVNVGDITETDFGTSNFTVECVIYIDPNITVNTSHFKGLVIKKGAGAANAGFGIYYNTGQQKFLWSTADGSSAVERFTTNTWSSLVGKYAHIVMVRDSTATNTGHFFINGVYESITSGGSLMNVNNNFNLTIGASSTLFSNYFFNGKIPVAKIYNRALTANEIRNNYNQYKGRFNI